MKKTERTFLEKIRLFLSPLKKNRSVYLIGILIFTVRGIDGIIYVVFLEKTSFYMESGNQSGFYSVLLIFFAYLISYSTFNVFFRKKGWTEISDTAIKYIQNIYLKKFIELDNNFIEKVGTGKLIAIINSGIDRWGRLLQHVLEQGIYVVISLIFTSYIIFKNSTSLFFLFLLVYIVLYASAYYLNLGALKYRRNRREWGNEHTKNLVKLIMTKNEVLHSDKIGKELEVLDYAKDREIHYNKKMSPYLLGMYELPNMMIASLILFVLYYFGGEYFNGNYTLSQLFGLTAALLVMLSAINKGIDFFKNFTKEFTDVEKLWEFFEETPTIQGYDTGENFQIQNGTISLKNVTFGYTQNQNIFENFYLKLQGEKVTALVGPSGGGKSTLVKLIAGYIHTDKGDIIIDDQKLSDVSLKSYYKNIGYLTQEPSVFDGTIRENLGYALEEEVGEDKMKEVLELAECQFVYNLEKGIDTEIGERGVRLSGGQKQRLAIAKIFLKNPKIIILDEPTSALDSISEKKISNAMEKLFAHRTVIIIAHRLQTVKHADEIIYIQDGSVVERGNHKELVKQKGLYNEMLELQSGF